VERRFYQNARTRVNTIFSDFLTRMQRTRCRPIKPEIEPAKHLPSVAAATFGTARANKDLKKE
jgi:hypothetical protein